MESLHKAKVVILKEVLSAIGNQVDKVVMQKHELGEYGEKWCKHLWMYTLPLVHIVYLAISCLHQISCTHHIAG